MLSYPDLNNKRKKKMEINELKQAKNLLMSKEKILLLTHQKMDADWLSSMLALWVFLERLWKQVKIVSTDPVPESFEFLPFTDKVLISSNAVKDFVISIKTNWAEIDRLRYNTEWDKLNIIVTPKSWDIKEDSVSYNRWIWKFDLIVCVDTWDLDYLWSIYTDNVEMFYETPIINIDHHVTNTAFWQINLVDITASSSTMIIFDLMKEFSENWNEMIDEDVATLLMAWLITDTWSFQHNNTSPRSLDLAADLMDFWARQQEIIKNIYKTKHLSTLKIWWKILSKIQEDPIFRMVWSTVTKEDLKETWANLEEADLLIDELMTNAPWAEVVILIKESFDWEVIVSMRSTSITVDISEIAKHFWWWWHKQAAWFRISKYKNFELEVWKIISYIQDFQKNRLWISDEEIAEIEKRQEFDIEKEEIWDISRFIDIQKENDEHLRDTWIEFPKSVSFSWELDDKEDVDLPFSVEKKSVRSKEASEEKKKWKDSEKIFEEVKKESKKQELEKKSEVKKEENEVKKSETKKEDSEKTEPKKEEKIFEKKENETKKAEKESEKFIKEKQTNSKKPEVKVIKEKVKTPKLEEKEEKKEFKKQEVEKKPEAKKEEKIEKKEPKKETPKIQKAEELQKQKAQKVSLEQKPAQKVQLDEQKTAQVASQKTPATSQPTTPKPITQKPTGSTPQKATSAPIQKPQVKTVAQKAPQTTAQSPKFETANIQQNRQDQNVQTAKTAAQQNQGQTAVQNQSSSQQPQASQAQANVAAQASQQSAEWSIVTKEQADGYARRFYELLQQTQQTSPEYKKYYDWYMYYAKLAGWNI